MLRFLKSIFYRSRPSPTKTPSWRPTLEVLEDRTLLSGAGFIPGDMYVSSRLGAQGIAQVTPTGVVTPLVTGIDTDGVAFGPNGNLYAAHIVDLNTNGSIYEVTPAGAVFTFATGMAAPAGLAFDNSGNLYVAEALGNDVKKITPNGVVSIFATGIATPTGLAFDSSGNLYVASQTGGYVDEITPNGVVSTFATGFDVPVGLTFDGSGNLYVANNTTGNNTSGYISEVTPGGVVSTFATGFIAPEYIAFDSSGNLFVPEFASGTISMVGPGGGTATLFASGFAGTESIAFAPTPVTPTVALIAANATYTGLPYDTANLSTTVTPATASGSISYVFSSDANGQNVIATPITAGTYYAQAFFTSSDPTHFTDAASNIVPFTITPAALTVDATTQGTINIAKAGTIAFALQVTGGLVASNNNVAALFNGATFTITVGDTQYSLTATATVASDGTINFSMEMSQGLQNALLTALSEGNTVDFGLTALSNDGDYTIAADAISRLINQGKLKFAVV